jgi:phosphotransferase system HPr (HPr) family protein
MDEPVARRATVRIVNKKGLHARASAKMVEAAARFQSQITVSKDGQIVDARSIMGLMMLGAKPGNRDRDRGGRLRCRRGDGRDPRPGGGEVR